MSDGSLSLSSIDRVRNAAVAAGLPFEPVTMQQSTRTAAEAAAAIGCTESQIVKSLIFESVPDGRLVLLLVSGSNNVDLNYISENYRLVLKRADIKRVRDETGFAIGGVAPFGHMVVLETCIDLDLLAHDRVHAAAGRPDTVFAVEPQALLRATKAKPIVVRPS